MSNLSKSNANMGVLEEAMTAKPSFTRTGQLQLELHSQPYLQTYHSEYASRVIAL